jgi:predicted 3-demethylubiquinone-9 3-methyltransferase (glyoxalase superfamily)
MNVSKPPTLRAALDRRGSQTREKGPFTRGPCADQLEQFARTINRDNHMAHAQKVSTCLWFNTEAEPAAQFYVSLFENSRITGLSRYGKGARMPEGTVLVVTFELAGTEFMALNGGPLFRFTEASSMVVQCDSQSEIDRLWTALIADGGKEVQCGWLKDRYGLSWQIVPSRIRDMMQNTDQAKTDRAFAAVMTMVKIDIAKLEAAYEGK